MAFTLDPETQKISFGVVSDGTNDAISLPLADQFGATEDFNDDFSSYATQGEADTSWVSADTTKTRVNITTDKLDFNIIRDDTNDAIVHDLGVVSDSLWVLRFKLTIDTLNLTALQTQGWIGLFDGDQTEGEETTQSGIGILLTALTGTLTYRTFDNVNALLTSGVEDTFTHALAVETIYVEIRRTSSTTYEVNLYSDPNYTALIESQQGVCSASLTGLRYIGLKNNMSATLGSSILGSMDDIQFWDGISTPVIRSENWRIRFKLDITNLDDGGNSIDKRLYIGLFDEDATSGADNTQDGYLLMLAHDNTDNLFTVRTPDGQQPRLATDDATFSTSPSETTRWIELRRDNDSQTTTSIYSDATFTTLVESEIVSGISGSDNLRYLKLMNDVGFTGAGAIDGTFDDLTYTDISDLMVSGTKTFTIDAIVKEVQLETFTIDAIKKGIFSKTFKIDGIPFAPPAILITIDARLFIADFGDFRDIGDLIIRVLTENPLGLNGREIVDEIRIITEMEPEWGFLGKTHRVKGWVNYLFKNGVIQNDGSDPDWWQTVWILV